MTCPNRPHGEYDPYCEACDGRRAPLMPPAPEPDRAAALAWAQHWRGIEATDACPACAGAGTHWYSSTATWRGGMGGQAFTRDVCDQCWGSGDRTRPWLNLRTLRDDQQREVAKLAVDALARACGAQFSVVGPQVRALIVALDELADAAERARKPRPGRDTFFVSIVRSLKKLIEQAIP